MKQTLKTLPALLACWLVCLTSGCAGMSGMTAKSDHLGGVVVYDTEGSIRRAVARIDAQGNRYVLPPKTGELERGGGGVDSVDASLEAAAKDYCGPSDGEWWLAFTVVYLIVLMIEVIIAAIDEAN